MRRRGPDEVVVADRGEREPEVDESVVIADEPAAGVGQRSPPLPVRIGMGGRVLPDQEVDHPHAGGGGPSVGVDHPGQPLGRVDDVADAPAVEGLAVEPGLGDPLERLPSRAGVGAAGAGGDEPVQPPGPIPGPNLAAGGGIVGVPEHQVEHRGSREARPADIDQRPHDVRNLPWLGSADRGSAAGRGQARLKPLFGPGADLAPRRASFGRGEGYRPDAHRISETRKRARLRFASGPIRRTSRRPAARSTPSRIDPDG